jgi:hypothetical protein
MWYVGVKDRYIQNVGGKNLMEGDNLKNQGTDGRILLKWIFCREMRGA